MLHRIVITVYSENMISINKPFGRRIFRVIAAKTAVVPKVINFLTNRLLENEIHDRSWEEVSS
jgi:hypothetical protein